MTDPTFGSVFWNSVSGAMAVFAGSGLSWFFFVSPHLKNLELYKEKVRVFQEVCELIEAVERSAEILKDDPDHVSRFSDNLDKFNSYVTGKNRPFVPKCVEKLRPDLFKAQEAVTIPPTAFSDPASPQKPDA